MPASEFVITARQTVTDPDERGRRLAQAFGVIEGDPLVACFLRAATRARALREGATQTDGELPGGDATQPTDQDCAG